MRTSTHFTQAEADALQTFALTNGLVIEGPQGEKNGEILADFIANKMNSDITAETLAAAFKDVRDQLVLKSPEQIGYEELHAALDSHEQAVFKQFRFGRLKDTYANAFRLLKFLKDRRMPVSERNLQIAAGQLGQALEYDNPAPVREAYGRHSNTKSDRASLSGDVVERIVDNSKEKYYQRAAESIQGRTHAETNELRKIVVTSPDGSTNWKETSLARNRAYEQASRPARVR
jgi:hypothetical protein